MAGQSSRLQSWGTDLENMPIITQDTISRITSEKTKTPQNSKQKGYKFFWDSYIHDVKGKQFMP
jgi:hypothetical protein